MIARLNPFDKHKAGLLSLRPQAGSDQIAMAEAGRAQTMEVVARVEQIERNINELRRGRTGNAAKRAAAALGGAQIPLEKLGKPRPRCLAGPGASEEHARHGGGPKRPGPGDDGGAGAGAPTA